MPYQHFRELPDEDVASIIVYLRALAPVRNPLPKTQVVFPVNRLMLSAPQPVTSPVSRPDVSDPVKRGELLVNAATCADCHTPQDKGQPIPGMDFAGGFLLDGPWGRVASANLTPDPSGIPYYDETRFVHAMKTGYVGARELNQIMPWPTFRNMADEDLKAIYAYLKTLKPVRHRVDNTLPPTYCKVCRQYHGGGELN
jgi:mono/diheme cytochrome c family protein